MKPVDEVIVRQPDYLKAVDALVADVPVSTWKDIVAFGLISEYAADLSAPFADSQFEFNGKVIAGRQVQPPRWKRGVTEVEQALGRTGGPPLHRAAFQARGQGPDGRAHPQPARGLQGGH